MSNARAITFLPNRTDARRGLTIYFVVLLAGSIFFDWKIIQTGKSVDQVPLLILGLMYTPALSSVIARFCLREGFTDVSFRSGGSESIRVLWLVWAYPMIVGAVTYGIAWLTGLAQFQLPLPAQSHLYSESPSSNLLASLFVSATLGTAVSCVATFGEELGWRGYMLTRMIAAGMPTPILVSGIIWALWHVPIILSGQYASGAHPRLSAVLFVIGVVAESYLVGYVRLRSGSVWPAVTMHGAWNALIQGTFDRATVGTPFAVGESGWLSVIVSVGFVIMVTRRKKWISTG